jgi:hypothetical protein
MPTPATNAATGPRKSREQQMAEVLSEQNDVPIAFYGRLEDQSGVPLTDTTVKFSVRVYNGSESTVRRGQVVSDANGLFTISGYKGESLGVIPEKAGYALASLNGGGNYSLLYPEDQRVHPDPSNPVVIKMWKLQGAEPLVRINLRYRLHCTNTPINFDLLTGQTVPSGGDIRITVNRSSGVISSRNHLDWSIKIEAVEGGVMDSSGQEAVTYSAPTEGYQPSEAFMFSTNAPYKWSEGLNKGLFVMSRNGQVFSKLGLSVSINYDPDDLISVTFGGVASTNGSRNWEGDSNTYKPQ